MSQTIKVALAGAGAFGLKHLDAIRLIDGVECISVVGRDLDKTQEAANKFQAQSQQKIDQLKEMAAKMQSDTGKKTMADYQKMMELANKIKDAAAAPIMAQMLWIVFEIPVKDRDPVLVNKIFDAKEINPQMAPAFQYAHYTVHIENKTNVKKQ